MEKSIWKGILNRTQHEQLSLVSGCLFAVMILLTLRDILNSSDFESNWMYLMEYVTLSIALLIWVASVVKVIPASLAPTAVSVSLLCISVKAGVAVLIWNEPGPANVALTLFGAGLALLSLKHLIIVQTITFGFWLVSAVIVLSPNQYLPIMGIAIVGAILGAIIQNHRLATLREIFELRHRVESLESILPMCAGCKKTRIEDGSWVSVESYIESHDEGTVITHGLCPDCKDASYGEFFKAAVNEVSSITNQNR